MKNSKLKILFVASEAAPYVKVGGLGEVMRSLPKALRELGHDARVMVPKYASIEAEKFPMNMEIEGLKSLTDESDPNKLLVSNVLSYKNEDGEIVAYFLENMEYYEKRANVYGYNDDTIRWVLLSKGVLEFLRQSDWRPDIIVAADWQTGFIPNFLRTEYKNDPILKNIKVIFSIHNLKYQGMLDQHFVSEMDFDSGQSEILSFFDERLLKLNGMRRGIMYADFINTVSPTYAKEILNDEFGEKLNELLVERRSVLYGILNGIDVDFFDPQSDRDIAENYSAKSPEKKAPNKLSLQQRFSLPSDENRFVIGIVSRMDEQKGFDLIIKIADSLLQNIDFQLIVVGTGSNEYRCFFQELQKKYPEKIGGHYFFDDKLPRMVFAGSDAVLIPSRYEPSGLVQMEAMRYGAIPIVRKTGGLADSVEDYSPGEEKGTGFVFKNYDQYGLLIAIIRASETFRNKKEWQALVKRAMHNDFSWKKSAQEYLRLFHLAVEENNQELAEQ